MAHQKCLLICLIGHLLFCQICSAQTTLAKLKYEEAEKAFQENNYKSTLLLIEEVENMIKGTSPKTLYLKILAKNKIGPVGFKAIQSLRADCAYFMDKYDNVEDNEDRYREVYEISKSLTQYPKTEEEFEAINKRKEELKRLEQQEEAYRKKVENYIIGLFGVNIGVDKAKIPPKILSELKFRNGELTSGNMDKAGYYRMILDSNEKIDVVFTTIKYGKNIEGISQVFETMAREFTSYFGGNNVQDTTYTYDQLSPPQTNRIVKLKKIVPKQFIVTLSLVISKNNASLYRFAYKEDL